MLPPITLLTNNLPVSCKGSSTFLQLKVTIQEPHSIQVFNYYYYMYYSLLLLLLLLLFLGELSDNDLDIQKGLANI